MGDRIFKSRGEKGLEDMARKKLENIKEIRLAIKRIGLNKSQCWYETEKSYEIWQEGSSGGFVRRFPKNRVFWVIEK